MITYPFLQVHLIDLIEFVPVVDVVAAEMDLKRLEHVRDLEAQPRGFHTDVLLTIEQQLQYTAFQSAALMATGQCWPKKWGVGDCDKGKNSGRCGGERRK